MKFKLVFILGAALLGALIVPFLPLQHATKQAELLETALVKYEKIQSNKPWPAITEGRTFNFGMYDVRVKILRKRLLISGELEEINMLRSDTFDIWLDLAVKKFQADHGIAANGIVDRKTIKELNVPVSERINQIKLNITRWKELSLEKDSTYILVNIAPGILDVYESDFSVLNMRVIVGRAYRRTPVFNSQMQTVEFNPYWVIPPGILEKDILPKIKKDSHYFEKNNMEVYYENRKTDPANIKWDSIVKAQIPYKIIQKPCSENPMGVLKFSFPNQYFVYFHDTPSKELFNAQQHTFSSGCIRLQDAKQLAYYILKKGKVWNQSKIDSLINTGKNYKVNLIKPVKIYISYFTSWVNTNGELQFTPDVYNRDKLIK